MRSGFAPKTRREEWQQWNDDGQAHQVHQHDRDDGQDAFEIEFIGGRFRQWS